MDNPETQGTLDTKETKQTNKPTNARQKTYEHHRPTNITKVNSCPRERYAIPAFYKTPAM